MLVATQAQTLKGIALPKEFTKGHEIDGVAICDEARQFARVVDGTLYVENISERGTVQGDSHLIVIEAVRENQGALSALRFHKRESLTDLGELKETLLPGQFTESHGHDGVLVSDDATLFLRVVDGSWELGSVSKTGGWIQGETRCFSVEAVHFNDGGLSSLRLGRGERKLE